MFFPGCKGDWSASCWTSLLGGGGGDSGGGGGSDSGGGGGDIWLGWGQWVWGAGGGGVVVV